MQKLEFTFHFYLLTMACIQRGNLVEKEKSDTISEKNLF
jgi:hypothetical protein